MNKDNNIFVVNGVVRLVYVILSNVLFLLGGIFIVLKLFGIISWSWVLVTCPFWIFVVPAIYLIYVAIVLIINKGRN